MTIGECQMMEFYRSLFDKTSGQSYDIGYIGRGSGFQPRFK